MLFGGFFLVRLFGCGALAFFPGHDDDFEAAVFTRLERAVRLENVVERVSFRNKAARVDEPLLDEGKRLFEPRCIHIARFEDEILAVHARQRQRLVVLVRCCRAGLPRRFSVGWSLLLSFVAAGGGRFCGIAASLTLMIPGGFHAVCAAPVCGMTCSMEAVMGLCSASLSIFLCRFLADSFSISFQNAG